MRTIRGNEFIIQQTCFVELLGCAHFNIDFQLISKMHFLKFHHEVVSCLLSRGKRKYAPLGIMKIQKTLFFWYTSTLNILCCISKTTKNLKLKFWIYKFIEKYIGFHLTSKNVLLSVVPWGMRMIGISSFYQDDLKL